MIPKTIHYCWFGGNPLSDLAVMCIESWKKYCPDYKIVRWDETNFNISSSFFSKEAYDAKKWAFVSDFARLKIIYENGGIYLDTDVELLKPLDGLLHYKCFLGSETLGLVATGLGFGAERHNSIVKLLLDEYYGLHFYAGDGIYDTVPCPKRNTAPLTKLGYKYSENKVWETEDVSVFPPEYFCPRDYGNGNTIITENTFSIHHYTASWFSKEDKEKEKEIKRLYKRYPKLIAIILKEVYLYKIEKKNGMAKGFNRYIIKKIKYKLNGGIRE